jgi:hypothetical protein
LGGLRPLTGQRRAAGRAELGAWRRGSTASCTFFFIHVFRSFFKGVLLLVFQAFFRFQDPKCASVRPYMVVLIFASFLRATSADCVGLAPPATFMRGQSGAVIFGRVHQPYRIQPTRRVPTEQAELPEFWRKTPAVVTGIRLRMAKAIFPYLQRYRSKGLTDTGANVVLTTQTQRDVFLFHVRLTAWKQSRHHAGHTASARTKWSRYSSSSSGSSSTGVGITFTSFSITFRARSRKIAASSD